MKTIEKILHGSGQQLSQEGWRVTLMAVSKVGDSEHEDLVVLGLKCMKLVIGTFL